MFRQIRPAIALLACGVAPPVTARANPPACADSSANVPYRVVVHTPPPSVVVIEGDGEKRWLKLFGCCHKEKKPAAAAAPASFFVPVPVMVPAAAPPCNTGAQQPCTTGVQQCQNPNSGPGGRGQVYAPTTYYATINSAGDDLRVTIARLKALRAERESEIAAIDVALAPVNNPTSRPGLRAVSAPIAGAPVGPTRQDLKDLNDKLDYLTALVDALADDVRKSDAKTQLPAFDELNGLRKIKP